MKEELVTVKVDHPLGSTDDDNHSIVYPINCGYIDKEKSLELASSLDRQPAYLVGVDTAVDEYSGVLIAVARRRDDSENYWIIAPENISFTVQQLEEMVYFNEQYYDSFIEMVDDELWDAYDRDEKLLGYDLKRSMAKNLPEGVFHIVVDVYTVTKGGKVLVTERSRNKTYPLKWEVTGGSILKGETPSQGAVRELKEETGIEKNPEDLVVLYHYTDEAKHCIYYAFMCVIDSEIHIKLQEGETMDYMYLSLPEFYKFVESDRFVPSEHKRFVKYQSQIKDIIAQHIIMVE
ncbi:MAG: NUDIX domain-containing protein [Lachnospira sp.]